MFAKCLTAAQREAGLTLGLRPSAQYGPSFLLFSTSTPHNFKLHNFFIKHLVSSPMGIQPVFAPHM